MTEPTEVRVLTPAPAQLGVRDLLRIPDFRRLYIAQAVSDVGDGMTYLALFLLILNLTGSTALIALVSILVALPPVTIGLFAGAWADRTDRRRIMLASDTARALLVAAMVLVATRDGIPALLALACLQAVVGTFFSPARMALVPRVVPDEGLLAANSISQVTRLIAGVVGASLTGLVSATAGVVWPVFLVDAATFLFSVALVLRVTPAIGRPDAAAAASIREQGMGHAVLDGLSIVRHSPRLVAALGGVSVTMLGVGAINVLFVPFLVGELGGSPALLGPMEGAQTLSMVLAGAFVMRLASRFGMSALMTGGIAGTALCIGLLGAAPAPWAVLLLMFAVGWFVMPVQAATTTIVQQSTTEATVGRVAGALNAVLQTATIVSMAAAGTLAAAMGMRNVFFLGAAITASAAVVAWLLFRSAPGEARSELAEAA